MTLDPSGLDLSADGLDASLLSDLAARLGTTDIFQWIDDQAEALALLGRTRSVFVDLNAALFQSRDIAAVSPDATIGRASIQRADGGYAILYRDGLPDLPRRFSIAHEIGHTLWFRRGDVVPLSPLQRAWRPDPTIEYLCDRFAAALLLPKTAFVNWFTRDGEATPENTLHRIRAAARVFRVAEQAVARRLFYHVLKQRLALVVITKSAQKNPEPRWRVSWSTVPGRVLCDVAILNATTSLSQGRVIPTEMVPESPQGHTAIQRLDGRWWKAASTTSAIDSRKPLRTWGRLAPKVGYSARSGDRIYLALPTDI